MPRIRTVKPEFFKHWDLYRIEIISSLPIRLSFQGLWLCADKEGRFKWQVQQLKLDVLPYDEVDFEEILNILCEFSFIKKYENDSRLYGLIPTFKDHQRITGSEAQNESKLPSPTTYLETSKKYEGNTLETLWKHQVVAKKKHLSISLEPDKYIFGNTLETSGKHFGNTLETQERKGKEIERNGDVGTAPMPKMTKIEFENFHKQMLLDTLFTNPLCMNKGIKSNDDLISWLYQYDAHIVSEGKTNKDYHEYRKHFKNWINGRDTFTPPPISKNGQPTIKLK